MQLQDYEQEHLNTLRALLPECMVLLKADGSFPLSEAGRLALYGSGARNTVKGGTGSGEVNSRFAETIEGGLTQAGFTITSKTWLDRYDARLAQARKDFKKVVKARARALHTQTVIAGMGMTMPEPEYAFPVDAEGDTAVYILSRKSGEGQDRQAVKGDLFLTDTETRDILTCNAKYSRFMLVLNVGGPVDLSPVAEVKNILVLSQPGVLGSSALADVLLGRANPSGKLATTWAAWKDYPALIDFGNAEDTRYREGIYVGYRYFESVGLKPLFPFGFGLSYTTFSLRCGGVSADGETVTVRAEVTNTGAYPGKEVAQLYVSKPWGTLDQPARELAAFGKTELLQPGQTQTLTLAFRMSELASYSEERAAYLLEQGSYRLLLGNSSASAEVCGAAVLPETVCVRQVRSLPGKPDFSDFRPQQPAAEPLPEGIPVLTMDPAAITRQTINYACQAEVPDAVKALSDEELVKACIGAFNPKGGMLSIIGNASQTVAGAAGETAHLRGFPLLVMADGPAGLRISRDYYADESGAHSIGQTMPDSIADLMSPPLRFVMNLMTPKPPKGAPILHQYATMLPIATAIAQSWNTALAAACGDIVGDEMKRFGVHLWLAPAMNIHRCILCGRNFEYYSEDPLLSGKMAAAVTRGVQVHPGCGVTVKHYAANNQENNRCASNSMVSERAMREIYLKGFEVCVRESVPAAAMTSYNLLNGVHVNESRALTTDVLRTEFGFRGIIMTDWLVGLGSMARGKHPVSKPEAILAAGSTLVMPGTKEDYDACLAALKGGGLNRQTLEQASAVLMRYGYSG